MGKPRSHQTFSSLLPHNCMQMASHYSISSHGKLTLRFTKPSSRQELQPIDAGFIARWVCPYDVGLSFIKKMLFPQSKFFRDCDYLPTEGPVNTFLIKPKSQFVLDALNFGRPWILRGMILVLKEVMFPLNDTTDDLFFEPMRCTLYKVPQALQNKEDFDFIFSCMGKIISIKPRNFGRVNNNTVRVHFMYDIGAPLLAVINPIFSDGEQEIKISYQKFPGAICQLCRILEHPLNSCPIVVNLSDEELESNPDPMDEVMGDENLFHPEPLQLIAPPPSPASGIIPPHQLFQVSGKRIKNSPIPVSEGNSNTSREDSMEDGALLDNLEARRLLEESLVLSQSLNILTNAEDRDEATPSESFSQ